jgi:hypothetical protein
MDWQQPNQTNNALPAYPYFPFYQQDSNQPSYNYDDDNEGWDDDEDNEGYQDQNAYYYNEHQNVDMTANMRVLDGVVSLNSQDSPVATISYVSVQSFQQLTRPRPNQDLGSFLHQPPLRP